MTKAEKKEMRDMIRDVVTEILSDMAKKGKIGVKVVERRIVQTSDGSGCQY